MSSTTPKEHVLQTMPAAAFYAAVEGPELSLQAPRLQFYHRANLFALEGQPETRMFIVSTVAGTKGRPPEIAGLAELDTNPDNADELWLFYVSVHPAHQHQGHGRALLHEVVKLVQRTGQRLGASYASQMSIDTGFQPLLNRTFDEAGIRWSQTVR